MTEERRRSPDNEITQIKSEIKHLAESDVRMFEMLRNLQNDYEAGFKELRNLIISKDKPQWQLYVTFAAAFFGFLVYQSDQLTRPIEMELSRQRRQMVVLDQKLDTHTSNGHPYTVISRLENLESSIDTDFDSMRHIHESDKNHLERWLKRVDEKGSVIHYGPKVSN